MSNPFPNPNPWSGDPAELAESARVILRLAADDPDVAGRLVPLAWSIVEMIKDTLCAPVSFDDPSAAPIPETIHQAGISALVEAYRRKDAPFNITGAWNAEGVAIRVTPDWLDGVRFALQPYRAAFGIA